MQRDAGDWYCEECYHVSILTRAFARVQRKPRPRWKEGRPRFNPHSSFRPSATSDILGDAIRLSWVSILTRAFARVQHTLQPLPPSYPHKFQSSLELSPECNQGWILQSLRRPCFNPHSSFRPSATRLTLSPRMSEAEFQSSLELSPECNEGAGGAAQGGCISFNPHSSFRPSATLGRMLSKRCGAWVSILTRAFARVQRQWAR